LRWLPTWPTWYTLPTGPACKWTARHCVYVFSFCTHPQSPLPYRSSSACARWW
jgi:hypothetical protein